MTDPFNLPVAFKEVSNLVGLDQGPPCVEQTTCWDIMRKSTLSETKFRPGLYTYSDLKWHGKFIYIYIYIYTYIHVFKIVY